MITDPEGTVLALFAAFCRIGACLMLLPGFGQVRVPAQIRLFLAVAVSIAILPLVWEDIYPRIGTGASYIAVILAELMLGVVFGLVARFYVLALQFASTTMAMLIGYNAPPAPDVLEVTGQPELATLIGFSALMVLFALDFHHLVFVALTNSYGFMPLGQGADPGALLVTLTDTLSESFMIVIQLASPFIVYGLIFNVAIGMVNKLAPQIPIFFISQPFLIAGGLILMFFAAADFFHLFAARFGSVFVGN